MLTLNNTHLHDFGRATTRKIVNAFNNHISLAQADPRGKSITYTAGDFNFLAENEQLARINISSPSAPVIKTPDRNSNIRAWWAPLVEQCTELHQPDHTRLGHSHNSENHHFVISSRIDRIYVSLAPWQLTNLNSKTFTFCPVSEIEKHGGSDHTPVCNRLACKNRLPRDIR